MVEAFVGAVSLIAGGTIISYAYSALFFNHPEDASIRSSRAAFRGFERRDAFKMDRREADASSVLDERRASHGRRATDRRH